MGTDQTFLAQTKFGITSSYIHCKFSGDVMHLGSLKGEAETNQIS